MKQQQMLAWEDTKEMEQHQAGRKMRAKEEEKTKQINKQTHIDEAEG